MSADGATLGVAVLASGSGSNFQSLIDRLHDDSSCGVRLVGLVASRPGIGALERAERAGISTAVLPSAVRDGPVPSEPGEASAREAEWLLERLQGVEADLVVLAGYLRLVPAGVVRRYRGRMINIHPALLPSFGGEGMYGRRVHETVLEAGCRVTGPTVHFVNEVYDRGAIIAQWPVPVREGDDPESLAARVLEKEHRLLPAVVRAFAEGGFRLTPEGRCEWSEDWFGADGFRLRGGAGMSRYMFDREPTSTTGE